MNQTTRELYLPNLPLDEQRHQLELSAIKVLSTRTSEVKQSRVYVFSTYLGKFIMMKGLEWEVQWLTADEQVTLTQDSGGVWGDAIDAPSKPGCLTKR